MLAIVCNDEEIKIKTDDLENKQQIQNYLIWRKSEIMGIFSTWCVIPLSQLILG